MTVDHPLVSVIIPTYNRAGLLPAAIRSVLEQSYSHLECIVVDDGSTDQTVETLQREFDKAISLVSKANGGVSSARNAGIRKSRGHYIAFLDSDDVWLPEKIARQMTFFETYPDYLICQTTEQWVRKGRRVNPPQTHKKKGGDIFRESLERCMITPSSVMMKRSLLDEVGLFDESMPVCEDYDLWLRVTWRHPVGLVEEELLIRNGGRPDQLSANHSLDKFRIQALQKLLDAGNLNPIQAELVLNMLIGKSTIYSKGCLKRNRTEEAQYYCSIIERYGKREREEI